MSKRKKSKASGSTCSRASAAGTTRCSSPAGRQLDLFGQEVAPVSRSRRRGSGKGKPTTGTSGPICSGSSASAALTQSLANRLRQRLGTGGSMEYSQTWNQKATPAGRLYWAHTASALRISDSDCGGWPTATTQDTRHYSEGSLQKFINHGQVSGHSLDLNAASQMAGWPTPDTPIGGGRMTKDPLARVRPSGSKKQLSPDDAAQLAGWNTPRATDGSNGGPNQAGGALPADASMAGWATPTSRDHKDGTAQSCENVPTNALLGRQVHGIPAETAKPAGYRLNPLFSLWLQGYPAEWASCGVRGMQSCPPSLPRSLRRSSKAKRS